MPLEALRHFDDDPRLSIYRIPDYSELPRLIAAFALGHNERLQPSDCLVVDEGDVDLSPIGTVQSDGDVPDPIVRKWHLELLDLNAEQVRRLAFEFGRNGFCRRATLGRVKQLVRMASDRDYYDRGALSSGVARDADKALRGASLEQCDLCHHRAEAHEQDKCSICALARMPSA